MKNSQRSNRSLCTELYKEGNGYEESLTSVAADRIKDLEKDLKALREVYQSYFIKPEQFKTLDGITVRPGQKVYVRSSSGKLERTTVGNIEVETDYELFGKIPVSRSFYRKPKE